MFYRRLLLGMALLFATKGFAQSEQNRSAMIDSYAAYLKSGNSILSAPPITHLVPNFNTITYSLAYQKQNITILPRTSDGDLDKNANDQLAITGYTIAPHLAISLKKVGIGFSIENSKSQALYSYSNLGTTIRQESTVSASGLGFNLSALPFEKLRKENKLAVIVGGKSLNVKHEYTGFQYNSTADDTQSVRYNLLHYEAGANLTLGLLKHFAVIPWMDYSGTDVKGAESAFNEERNGTLGATQYADDLRMFYQSLPRFRYGVDLSINIFDFDIRIGSLLGSLASLNSQPDFIKDRSFTISLSFDQKGG